MYAVPLAFAYILPLDETETISLSELSNTGISSVILGLNVYWSFLPSPMSSLYLVFLNLTLTAFGVTSTFNFNVYVLVTKRNTGSCILIVIVAVPTPMPLYSQVLFSPGVTVRIVSSELLYEISLLSGTLKTVRISLVPVKIEVLSFLMKGSVFLFRHF